MPTVFLPSHINVLVRPGVGVQCGTLPHSTIILPLPPDISAGHVAQVINIARQPVEAEQLSQGLGHCGFSVPVAKEIVDELMRAHILLPKLEQTSPIYVLETGMASAHTSLALKKLRVPHVVTEDPARARSSILLTGGNIFLPTDLQYRIMTLGIIHFPHGVVDGRIVMGPLIIPGVTPCLSCLDALYAQRDSGWRAIRIQAGARPGARDRSELEAAALSVARLTRDVLTPWQLATSHAAARPAVPDVLRYRRLIRIGTLEAETDVGTEDFHEDCPVCKVARVQTLAKKRAAAQEAPALAKVGNDS